MEQSWPAEGVLLGESSPLCSYEMPGKALVALSYSPGISRRLSPSLGQHRTASDIKAAVGLADPYRVIQTYSCLTSRVMITPPSVLCLRLVARGLVVRNDFEPALFECGHNPFSKYTAILQNLVPLLVPLPVKIAGSLHQCTAGMATA